MLPGGGLEVGHDIQPQPGPPGLEDRLGDVAAGLLPLIFLQYLMIYVHSVERD